MFGVQFYLNTKYSMAGKPRGGKRKMWKRRRFVRRPRQVNVNRALQPIAQRYLCKLKYSQTFSISAINPIQQFNLNSLYDPDRTGLGHQPNSFDQLAGLYNRYRVISTTYAINTAASSAVRVAAVPSNANLSALSLSDVVERPKCKWIIQHPGGNTKTLKGSVYIPSLMGRNKTQYMTDDNYQALTTASPSELALLNIYGKAMNDDPVDISCVLTMTFFVEFYDIIPQTQS